MLIRLITFLRRSSSVISALAAMLVCSSCGGGGIPDPAATIRSYCESKGGEVGEFFAYPIDEKVMGNHPWKNCVIVGSEKTRRVGERFSDRITVLPDDYEVVSEVTLVGSSGSEFKTRFWYLLRLIEGKWKIIEYSHISDENVPAYD